jgi:alpha-tubulin suppressor-like RCC1 family protein
MGNIKNVQFGKNVFIVEPTNLYGWGLNKYGQIQLNSTKDKSVPVQCYSEDYDWEDIDAGGNFSAGIKKDGTLWIWGQNEIGQLGTNDTNHRSSPIQTVALASWMQISLGERHSAAIRSDGTLWTWGYNLYGQLGCGDIYDRSSPTQTTMYGSAWTSVACGEDHTVAIDNSNRLWAWGFNSYGQLGNNSYTHTSSPVQTAIGGNDWFRIACGSRFTAAIKNDFSLWLWGRNNKGQLGSNNKFGTPIPQREIFHFNDWEFISCGNHHTAAIKKDGTLYVW